MNKVNPKEYALGLKQRNGLDHARRIAATCKANTSTQSSIEPLFRGSEQDRRALTSTNREANQAHEFWTHVSGLLGKMKQ